jgi:hypothetical protein
VPQRRSTWFAAAVASVAVVATGCEHPSSIGQDVGPSASPSVQETLPDPVRGPLAHIRDDFPNITSAQPVLHASAQGTKTFTLGRSRSTSPSDSIRVFLLCEGSSQFTVETADNFYESDCASSSDASAAIPFNSPQAPTTVRVLIPQGTNYWVVCYLENT